MNLYIVGPNRYQHLTVIKLQSVSYVKQGKKMCLVVPYRSSREYTLYVVAFLCFCFCFVIVNRYRECSS